MIRGSRFEILSNNTNASLGAENKDSLEAIIRRKFNMGADMRGYSAVNGRKKQLGKDKGKGIAIASGPKIKVSVLKASNSNKAGTMSNNPLDEGPKMGLKFRDNDQGPITFTAVGNGLYKSKHVVVRLNSGKRVD